MRVCFVFFLALLTAPFARASIHVCQNENSALLLRKEADKLILEDFVGGPALSAVLARGGLSLPLELAADGTKIFPGAQPLALRTEFFETGVRLGVGIGVGPMKLNFSWNCGADAKPKTPRAKATKPSSTDPFGQLGPITPL